MSTGPMTRTTGPWPRCRPWRPAWADLGHRRVVGGRLGASVRQDRVAVNQGNIVGQDLGPTGGFAVVSLNGGWRPRRNLLVTAGVDNLFNRAYAEHLSRNATTVPGFDLQSLRVNEPGRNIWVKLNIALD